MKKTTLLVLIICIAILTPTVFAQKNHRGNKETKNMSPEMKSYINDNILPVMKVQRMELEEELSSLEKARLDEIRIEMKTMRQQKAEQMIEMRESGDRPSLEQRKEMREMRNKMHNLMNEVEIMAEDHDQAITRLLDEIQPQMEDWRRQMRNLKQENRPNKNRQGNKVKNRNRQDMSNMQGPPPDQGRMFGRHMGPVGFLLWDPNQPLPFFNEQGSLEDNLQLNIYPNPATEKVQISVQLEEEANTAIVVFDKDGNEVMSLSPENAPSGLYSRTIDVSGLTDGLYILKVNSGEKSAIGRMIVRH